MRYLILIFLMATASFSQTSPIEPGVSQELAKWRAAHYSDVRYNLDLKLEKMSPVLKGTMEIRVKVRDAETRRVGDTASTAGSPPSEGRGGSLIVLDWRKIKGHEEKSTISKVSINGRELSVEESNEHLIFRDGVVAGENVIKLDFTSPILPSGSAITRYIDKEDGSEYIYSLFVPSDASTAFPVFDQPDLKARFTLKVTMAQAWKVVSNSSLDVEETRTCINCGSKADYPESVTYFHETKPISTYVFAFAAGPWQQVSPAMIASAGRNPSGSEGANPKSKIENPKSEDTLPTGRVSASSDNLSTHIYVRKSQLAKFQPHAAEVFRLNREAIKYFEEYFDYKFPFPKYDLVLIPEFPFGGMEHAGATFLREASVIFPQEPTKNDHVTRATLIFHEAAHQWFGDTVTMRWFDDLWLKEGFATFTAYKAMEKIMPEMNSWKVFYERIKQGAYQTDSTKGTTAIYQPIANLSAAKSAYGNIVYNKAPAFLRQAEFYLGEDKFQAAVRAFLKKHEFGNATWEDLVTEFENAEFRSRTASWSVWPQKSDSEKAKFEREIRQAVRRFAESWVKTRGMARVRRDDPEDDSLFFGQENILGDPAKWDMKIKYLAKARDGYSEGEVSISSFLTASHFSFARNPFIFPNYQDYGYGIFLLDDMSRDYVLKNIQNEKDPFLRSMMWGALWDSVREGELDPTTYVELVLKNLTTETDESIVQGLLSRTSTALTYYIAQPAPKSPVATAPGSDLRSELERLLIQRMQTAETLGQRITFYRAFLNVASSENARGVLKGMLRQKSEPGAVATGAPPANAEGGRRNAGSNPKSEPIPLKTKDRFDIVTRLASLGDPDAEGLLKELEKTETTDDAKRYAYAARAAFPTKETKEKYWNDFINNKQISESWIEAAFGPFNSVRHADLTLPYLERALKELPNHKRNRKIFFVNGWLGAFIGGQRSEEALSIVNKFLADNPNLDRDLRLKILENVDVIERAVKIRGKYATRR